VKRIPSEIDVDLLRTVVTARLPIPVDRSTWFLELHPAYVRLRRGRTTEWLAVDFESLIQRAIKSAVEEARRFRKRKGGRGHGSN